MKKMSIDPNFDTMLLCTMTLPECPEMLFYENVYFTKDAFAKQVYLGANGVFLIIPLLKDELENDLAEQKKVKDVLTKVYEKLSLHLYVYPVFVGEERSFFVQDIGKIMELEEPGIFLTDLYHYTLENKLEPCKVLEKYSEIKGYTSGSKKQICVLDEGTLERLTEIITPLEGIERPCDRVRYEADGTKYIQKDSDLKIGKINTGLIGKRMWYRVSEMLPKKLACYIALGGTIGLHKFMTGEFGQGFLYLLTSGFGGIFPLLDLVALFTGSYSYQEVTYYQEACGIQRKKEKVYVERCSGLFQFLLSMGAALLLGMVWTNFIYAKALELIIQFIVEVGVEIAEKSM